jgi:hypothetical protein
LSPAPVRVKKMYNWTKPMKVTAVNQRCQESEIDIY